VILGHLCLLGLLCSVITLYHPGPDLTCNAHSVLPGLINNIQIAIFAKEVAPGRALGTLAHLNIGL
jgi:hypothetical protein